MYIRRRQSHNYLDNPEVMYASSPWLAAIWQFVAGVDGVNIGGAGNLHILHTWGHEAQMLRVQGLSPATTLTLCGSQRDHATARSGVKRCSVHKIISGGAPAACASPPTTSGRTGLRGGLTLVRKIGSRQLRTFVDTHTTLSLATNNLSPSGSHRAITLQIDLHRNPLLLVPPSTSDRAGSRASKASEGRLTRG